MADYSTWAVVLDGKKVRIDDMSIAFWQELANDLGKSDDTIALLLQTPVNQPELGRRIVVEAARLLKKPDPEAHVAKLVESEFGETSLRLLGDLFVPVEDDLPTQLTDGVPPVGAGGSTDT